MQTNCKIISPECSICGCSGRGCQTRFPGLKVEWPELRGVNGIEAKRKIESENPHVTAVIYPEDLLLIGIMCCNRVVLYVPSDNCPNGPVINRPIVG